MLVYQYINKLNLLKPIRNKIKNYYYLNKWEYSKNKYLSKYDIFKNHYEKNIDNLYKITQDIFSNKFSNIYKLFLTIHPNYLDLTLLSEMNFITLISDGSMALHYPT